jgi:hypothetical protein
MSTLAMSSIVFTNNTDAEFRTWASYIHNTFALSSAWVNTSDTGQINLTTVVKPVAANTKSGYEIWRMNDTLQSTAPLFVRIDYGSNSNQLYPGVWITIGTGSDGAGTITGIKFNGGSTTIATIGTPNNATAFNSYGSAANNRITVLLGIGTSQVSFGFGIERTKDSAGADTATGFLLGLLSSSNMQRPASLSGATSFSVSNANALFYGVWTGTQAPFENSWQYILHAATSTAFNSDIGLGVPIPMATTAKQPGTNWALSRTGDFIQESQVTTQMYSGTVVFLRTARSAQICVALSPTADGTAAVMMRYD